MRIRHFNISLLILLILSLGTLTLFAQQGDRELGRAAFRAGEHSKAITHLKKALSANDSDIEAWRMLGSSYYQEARYKDSIKAFEKAVAIEPRSDEDLAFLAFLYSFVRDKQAGRVASQALAINPRNAEAHYVIGALAYRAGEFEAARESAARAIQFQPTFDAAYHLRSQVDIALFMASRGKVPTPPVPADLLPEAVADMEKYLAMTKDAGKRKELEAQLETLRYYANYYTQPENRVPRDPSAAPDPSGTPLKIVKKFPPSYPSAARARSAEGTVRLLVAFDASGRIGPILVIRSADPDLDRSAVQAARRITFTPAAKNGVPVSTVKMIEYTFEIY